MAIIAGTLELVFELGELEQGLKVGRRRADWCGEVLVVLLEACQGLACGVRG
jgi:hypothetical protein